MKVFFKIFFLIFFLFLFYSVGSFVVDSLLTLFPNSVADWFPLIKFLLWLFTFSFNFFVTVILYFLVIMVLSYFIKK